MSNKEKMLWSVFAGVLVLLFLLSSTDLIIKEEEKKVYSVSVIVSDTNDEYFTNFRKGMDRAAEKLQADVNFITLYYGQNVEEQAELIRREAKDGADAIVLEPVNETEILNCLDDMSISCPVVFLGEKPESASVTVSLHSDRYQEGKLLAEKMTEKLGMQYDGQIWIVTEGVGFSGNQKIYEGVTEILNEKKFSYRLIEGNDKEFLWQELIQAEKSETEVTILALDTASLDGAAELADELQEYESPVKGIYGIGSTMGILRQMERGQIEGVVVRNQYDEGYRSVSYAAEAAAGRKKREDIVMESFYIEKKDLRDPQYEKLLYPIE